MKILLKYQERVWYNKKQSFPQRGKLRLSKKYLTPG